MTEIEIGDTSLNRSKNGRTSQLHLRTFRFSKIICHYNLNNLGFILTR